LDVRRISDSNPRKPAVYIEKETAIKAIAIATGATLATLALSAEHMHNFNLRNAHFAGPRTAAGVISN
jgi:hypothetical protein